ASLAAAVYSRRPDGLRNYGGVIFYIYSIEAEFYGPDYRANPCEIPDSVEQLRHGSGAEPAWREAARLRRLHHADGALLPGETDRGTLFLFVSAASTLDVRIVETIRWPDQVVRAAIQE
ncbi:MAG: hypothetical protein ABR947_05600, partial [Solirubrobacteraceae bacterium]